MMEACWFCGKRYDNDDGAWTICGDCWELPAFDTSDPDMMRGSRMLYELMNDKKAWGVQEWWEEVARSAAMLKLFSEARHSMTAEHFKNLIEKLVAIKAQKSD